SSDLIPRNLLGASGSTALERRNSRVILWRNSGVITMGLSMRDARINCTFVTCCPEDIEELEKAENLGFALKYFESKGVKVTDTLELLGENWKFPVTAWNDMVAVNRQAERKECTGFRKHVLPDRLSADGLTSAALRMRLDIDAKLQVVLLNDAPLCRDDYKEWSDRRYKYIETDIGDNWKRAVLIVKTTPIN
ncbi:MAG: hypothetical protein PHV82_19325, partial [Victivallaceae bacterium]|nr:hypothetical protein [Victivallaceae bacterium]